MAKKEDERTVSDDEFKAAVRQLLNTPPQHKPTKKPTARKPQKLSRTRR